MLQKWLKGFERHFWNGGDVVPDAGLDTSWLRSIVESRVFSLDLLCDLHVSNIDPECTLRLGVAIADLWLDRQWVSGLFPEIPSGRRDHLDANVDLVVALSKLYAITSDAKYAESARRCKAAILGLHVRLWYCMAVDAEERIVDSRIVVKYQGLLLKLALLPDDPAALFGDPDLVELLRDR